MTVYKLKIKIGLPNSDRAALISQKIVEKTEYFKTSELRDARIIEIETAVTTINLVPWLIDLESEDFIIKE